MSKKLNSVSLSCYKIYLHEIGNQDPLSFSDPSHETLYGFSKAHLKSRISTSYSDEILAGSYSIDKTRITFDDDNQKIWGIANVGESGISATGKKGGKQVYKRDTETTEEIPLFFYIDIPNDAKEGFIIFQSFKNRRMKTVFSSDFIEEFGKRNNLHACKINPTLPDFLLKKQLANATPKEVILTGTYTPKTDTEAAEIEKGIKKAPGRTLKAKLVLSPYSNSKLLSSELKEVMYKAVELGKGKNKQHRQKQKEETADTFKELFMIENEHMQFDNAKLIVNLNGKRRTVNFHNQIQMAPDYDITESVSWGLDGHPTFDSLLDESLTLLKDLKSTGKK